MSRELWLDKATVCKVTGWSVRTVEHKAKLGELPSRASSKRGRNGKHEREFAASSLPGDVQAKLMQHRLAESHIPETQMAVIPHPETHADRQISLFISPPAISDEVRVSLSVQQNELAQRRLEAISPMIEFRKKSNGYKPVVKLGDGREIRNLDSLAVYIAAQHKISRATLWTWYSRFKEKGFLGLADDVRSDKGLSRFFVDYPKLAEMAQAKYLVEKLSVKRVHEVLERQCTEQKIDAPCYNTVRAYLSSQIPQPVSIMAREGETEFHKKCAPYILPNYASMLPSDEWVCDHAKHDVWVLNDCLAGEQRYAPIRPYVTAIIDMRTRALLSAVWCINPSSQTISTALRQAIVRHGIPKKFYVDNGKDFLSNVISGVLAQLEISAMHCIPRHPQSKNIERFFGTMHERFDSLWGDAYCGTSPSDRPEACDDLRREHEKLVKTGQAHKSRIKPASNFIALCQAWMENDYNFSPHGGRGMKDKATGDFAAPMEMFDKLLPKENRRFLKDTNSPHALEALFWKVEPRVVSEGGCVTIGDERYQPADAGSYGALFEQIARKILVARDPHDMGNALALDMDRKLIGYLQCQRLVARGPVAEEDIKQGMRMQRAARRVTRDYLNSLTGRYETELDRMRRNSGRMPAERGLPAPPEVMPPLRKVVGLPEPVFVGDMVKNFLEEAD